MEWQEFFDGLSPEERKGVLRLLRALFGPRDQQQEDDD